MLIHCKVHSHCSRYSSLRSSIINFSLSLHLFNFIHYWFACSKFGSNWLLEALKYKFNFFFRTRFLVKHWYLWWFLLWFTNFLFDTRKKYNFLQFLTSLRWARDMSWGMLWIFLIFSTLLNCLFGDFGPLYGPPYVSWST